MELIGKDDKIAFRNKTLLESKMWEIISNGSKGQKYYLENQEENPR